MRELSRFREQDQRRTGSEKSRFREEQVQTEC
jgi:hypothetical protein